MVVASVAVPDAFGDSALAFALGYAGVRAADIALYGLGSRGDPALIRWLDGQRRACHKSAFIRVPVA